APRSLHRPIHEGPAWRTIQQLPIRTIDEVLDNRGKGTETRTQACRAAREFGIRRVELPDRRSLAGLLVEGLPLQARICGLDVASQKSLDQFAHVLPHAALAFRDRLRRRNEARVISVTEGHSPITCDVHVEGIDCLFDEAGKDGPVRRRAGRAPFQLRDSPRELAQIGAFASLLVECLALELSLPGFDVTCDDRLKKLRDVL